MGSAFVKMLEQRSMTAHGKTPCIKQRDLQKISFHNIKPGGTTKIVCDNWTSRVVDREEDPISLGWWSHFTLRGKGQTKITIITAYNPTTSTGGKTNYRRQQPTLSHLHIQHKQKVSANPCQQFILDLQSWIEHLITLGHEIILAMDANSSYNPEIPHATYPLDHKPGIPIIAPQHNGKLQMLNSTCGLLDPLTRQHSSCLLPASHIWGSEKIDFILVTPGIFSSITASGSL